MTFAEPTENPRPERCCLELARSQLGLIARRQALELGLSRHAVQQRVSSGAWRRVHEGVFAVGAADGGWRGDVMAACLAAGGNAVASHRAAAVLWRFDGIVRAPVEITVPHGEEASLRGVVAHRSRLLDDLDRRRIGPIPVTIPERTLIDFARSEGEVSVEKALESALRERVTTEAAAWRYIEERGKGLPGARRLRRILLERTPGKPAGSGGEVELLRCLRLAGVPTPVRQYELRLPNGRGAVLDLAWPDRRVGAEWDGYDVHGGRRAHADDLERQNGILALGWTLRRYTGSRVRRDPRGITAEIVAALLAAA